MALASPFGPFLPDLLKTLAAAVPKLRCLHVKCALITQMAAAEAMTSFEHLETLLWTTETVQGEARLWGLAARACLPCLRMAWSVLSLCHASTSLKWLGSIAQPDACS